MATLSKVPVRLSGFLGGPGVNTFYFLGEMSGAGMAPVEAFYDTLSDIFPNDVTIEFPSSGVTVDSVTGDLTGSWAADAQPSVAGTNAGTFTAGAGAVVRWVTATVIDGRILRGRTFLVPLAATQYENNGLIVVASQEFIHTAAATLVDDAAGTLVVWHRPVAGENGAGIPVIGPFVPRTPAFLRSRRD